MKRMVFGSLALLMCVPANFADAGDWPQFRFDAQRSAASPEQLPETLNLQWVREFAPPRPAFPDEIRLAFDASYEPVVLGNTMFVPSTVTDSVTALDTQTGDVRWRFFTDGPVRFAPVAWKGGVYFTSDDGHLYCVDAEEGSLRWKFRGLPAGREDRLLLGNGRLISLRPARGGPVLENGIVYFGAGVWLGEGIFIHALDAETGKVVWSNIDSNLIEQANLDHGIKSFAGLSPQGYLAVLGGKLAIPCGAQLPGFLDVKTGKLSGYTMGWGGRVGLPKGSWLISGNGKHVVHSGDLFDMTRPNDEEFVDRRGRTDFKKLLYPGGFTRLMIDPTNQRALGQFQQPVITDGTLYLKNAKKEIVAYDLSQPKLNPRAKTATAGIRKGDRYPDKWKGTFPELWKLGTPLNVHIKAGGRLYVAGPGVVAAIDIPKAGDEPKISWRQKIDGTPHRLLAADGRLFVVTKEGRVLAFGAERVADPPVHTPSRVTPKAKTDRWTELVKKIVKQTDVTSGYALLLGVGSGRLAEELLRQTSVSIIAVDPNRAKVAALRERLHAAGLYGTRISVHVGDPLKFPFPPFLADLIVSEDPEVLGTKFDAKSIDAIFRLLRPYGGTVCLDMPERRVGRFLQAVKQADAAGAKVGWANGLTRLTRQGSLPGAADWSHAGANAANSGASDDRFLKAPLGMLWFDGSVRWHRKPGSAVIRVAEGTVFILADRLLAIDVFTGRHLWEVDLPSNLPSPRPEMVVASGGVYLPIGQFCLVLDPITGRTVRQIELPPKLAADPKAVWSRIRVRGDVLIAAVGKDLVCVDHRTGALRWSFRCQHANLKLALGENQVFCAEIRKLSRKPTAGEIASKPRTQAFDLKTGKPQWEIPEASELRYSDEHKLLLTTKGVYRAADGTLVRRSNALFSVVGNQLISTAPDKLTTFDVLTGKQTTKEISWYRRGCTDLRACSNLVTTRYRGNAAYVDLQTQKITPLWNVRAACNNNLVPANGVLNVPNLSGGCECNYTPVSMGLIPMSAIE
jgi:outer membrane protein assembly factor BamB